MTQTEKSKEVSKYNDQMQITMRGNSIRFQTPDGQVFYKNLENFAKSVLHALAHPTKLSLASAPRDNGKKPKPMLEQLHDAIVAEIVEAT